MNRKLKIPQIAYANLADMVRHWTPKPVIISCIRSSPTGDYFFAVVNYFEYNNARFANFVQTVKNSIYSANLSTYYYWDYLITWQGFSGIDPHCTKAFYCCWFIAVSIFIHLRDALFLLRDWYKEIAICDLDMTALWLQTAQHRSSTLSLFAMSYFWE